VLKCSHTFNLLDSRGAIGVTERANYFRRMRDLSRTVGTAYTEQRKAMEYPWLKDGDQGPGSRDQAATPNQQSAIGNQQSTFVFEIGSEELPATDVTSVLAQLRELAPKMLKDTRLTCNVIEVFATPRRQGFVVRDLASQQTPLDSMVRGPATKAAYDKDGKPTKAAEGFARGQGVSVDSLIKVDEKGNQYVYAKKHDAGKPAQEVLATLLPELIAALKFEKTMRWNNSGIAFSRP
jgi:glycyl-tRNA synthetase